MIRTIACWTRAVTAVAVCVAWVETAGAANLVANGGFETNGGVNTTSFSSWTETDQPTSDGSFFVQTGTVPPSIGPPVPVPPPPQGVFAAMTNQGDVSASFLYQDVTIPAGTASATFQARVYVHNLAAFFATPNSLDINTAPNQQARIDIVNPAAPINDTGAGVLLAVYRTNVGDPNVSGYNVVTANLTPFAGQTVRLRLAVVVTNAPLLFGVDDVSVTTATAAQIPTLPDWGPALLGLAVALTGIALLRARGRR